MDEGLKSFLETMNRELKGDIKGLTDMMRENASKSVAAHENTRKAVEYVARNMADLYRKVEGVDPPPPPPGSGLQGLDWTLPSFPPREPPTAKDGKPAAPATPSTPSGGVKQQLSDHDGSIAGIQGTLIAMSAQIKEANDRSTQALEMQQKHADAISEARSVSSQTLEMQKRQNKVLGIKPPEAEREEDKRSSLSKLVDGLAWMMNEYEGRKFALQLFAAASGLVMAIGTTYALVTGHVPLPNGVTPTVQQPVPYAAPPSPLPPSHPAPGGPNAAPPAGVSGSL